MIDFLKKIFGESPREAPAKERALIKTDLPGLESLIERKRDEALSPFFREANSKLDSILSLFMQVGRAADEFSKKPLKVENPQHEKIARQMKENYFVRIPKILSGVKKPKHVDYEEISRFHSETLRAMQDLTKITSDNRYLIFFYREEFERLGGPVKALAQESDALGALLEGNSTHFREGKALLEDARALLEEEKKLAEKKGDLAHAVAEAGAAKGRYIEGDEGNARRRASEHGLRIADIEGQISHIKTEIASLMLPLARLLRKFEKTSQEKALSKTAAGYLEDHLVAMRSEDPGLPRLIAVCGEIERLIEENKLVEEQKDRAKHSEIIGRIKAGAAEALLSNLKSAEQVKMKLDSELKDLEKELARFEALKDEVARFEGKVLGEEEALKAQEKIVAARKGSLSERAGAYIGSGIELLPI